MSKIQKALNDLAMAREATFETKDSGARIELRDDGARTYPLEVTISGRWFDVADLRHASKLFKKLAKQLEAEGRTE
ncbi:hypothetical protein ISF41_12375 [Burkholderia pseudomallei]|nr:hypothetical protein [Burkholderia pseudomallei]